MKGFRDMGIGGKLLLGFSIMVVLMVFIGGSGYQGISSVQEKLDDIFVTRLPSLDYLVQADRDLQQLLVAERSMIFATVGSEVFEKLVKDYEENLEQSRDRLQKYSELVTSSNCVDRNSQFIILTGKSATNPSNFWDTLGEVRLITCLGNFLAVST